MGTIIFKIIITCIAAYCLIVVLAYFFEEKMMFFPSGQFKDCPEADDLGVEAVRTDGCRYYARKVENPSFRMIFFHGNAGCACDRMYFIEMFKELDADLVVFEYPGYGGDSQKPSQQVILDEAMRLLHHLQNETSAPVPTYLAGESLGTGVATRLAAEGGAAGLILISPYTSITDVAAAHYPFLPVRLLSRNRFPAERWARTVTVRPSRFTAKTTPSFPSGSPGIRLPTSREKPFLLNWKIPATTIYW
ncbi:MAG: alpha/beta hydrolase [Desulfarculaceae bacterium]|nr:alpha/beta hydrolase [Desulfarculaceae bacterium]